MPGELSQPVVLLHVHMTPPLTSFNYWGKKYSIAQVENDICHFFKKKRLIYVDIFFLFFFVVKRERKGKGTYHCTAGQKIMFLCFSPQFLVLLKDLIWESPMEMGPQLSIHGHFLQLMGMIEPSVNISNFWEIK